MATNVLGASGHEEAPTGRLSSHQRFMLAVQLRHIDELDAAITAVSEEVEMRLRPFRRRPSD